MGRSGGRPDKLRQDWRMPRGTQRNLRDLETWRRPQPAEQPSTVASTELNKTSDTMSDSYLHNEMNERSISSVNSRFSEEGANLVRPSIPQNDIDVSSLTSKCTGTASLDIPYTRAYDYSFSETPCADTSYLKSPPTPKYGYGFLNDPYTVVGGLRFEHTTWITLEVYRAPMTALKWFRDGELRLTESSLETLGTAIREFKQTPGTHWSWELDLQIQAKLALISRKEKREHARTKIVALRERTSTASPTPIL